MRRFDCSRAVVVVGLVALVGGATGCQLLADFDRSKIDGGASAEPEDATTDGPATADGSVDARTDTGPAPDTGVDAGIDAAVEDANVPDAGEDASDANVPDAGEDASDANVPDAADANVPDAADANAPDANDAGTDANDAGTDANDGGDAGCTVASQCNDGNACTVDTCGASGQCVNTPVGGVDDGIACTSDLCDPSTGVISHAPIDALCTAGTKCQVAACDPTSGCVYPSKAIGDGVTCTDDSCDPSTGVVTHAPNPAHCTSGNACQTPTCDAVLDCQYPAKPVSDGVSCTDDSCNPGTGVITHTTNAAHCTAGTKCETASCDAVLDCQYPAKPVSDGVSCTVDACDPSTGSVTHTPSAALCTGGTLCQTASCDATLDCQYPAKPVSDGVSCTVDACNPGTGVVTHTADATLCTGGTKCQTASCDTSLDCQYPTTPVDDGVACTDDSCDLATGTISHAPDDGNCATNFVCDAVKGCVPHAIASAQITEIQPFGSAGNVGQFLEIANTGAQTGDLAGATLTDGAGAAVTIHPADDPTGALKHPLFLPAGTEVYGVANPLDPATIPVGAAFVWGSPGATWAIDAGGPFVALASSTGTALSTVDAKTPLAGGVPAFNADPNTTMKAGQYPGLVGKSMQLDVGASATGGSAWCTTFRGADTRGQPNQSCAVGVVNEVLEHFATPAGGVADEQTTFVEIATAGGASLGGMVVKYLDGAGAVVRAVTIPAGTRARADGYFVIADGDSDGGTTQVPGADLVLGDGIPVAAGTTGASVGLFASGGAALDALAYGSAASAGEGTPIKSVVPHSAGIAYARSAASADTGNNAADFHLDPTPTPGDANGAVSPVIVQTDLHDGLAAVATVVSFDARDVTDVSAIDGVTVAAGGVAGTFAGNTDAACVILGVTQSGRGDVVLQCTAPASGGTPARGDLVLASPVGLGVPAASVASGWTYTGVNNGTASAVSYCVIDAPTTATATAGSMTGLLVGEVYQAGVTDNGQGTGVIAQLGVGPAAGSDPTAEAQWSFVAGSYVGQTGTGAHNNQWNAAIAAPSSATVVVLPFAWRFSVDGGLTYTYCDTQGNGSNAGLPAFDPAQLGALTVNP